MTDKELEKFIEQFEKEAEAFNRGEIPDSMTPEARKDWIEKCNV